MVGPLAVDDLLREAELEMTTDPVDELGAVLTVPHVLDGPPDLCRVTPNLTTRVVELAALLGCCIRAGRAGAVPDVGVASHDHHHLVATGTDPDWRVGVLGWVWGGGRLLGMVITGVDRGLVVGAVRDGG